MLVIGKNTDEKRTLVYSYACGLSARLPLAGTGVYVINALMTSRLVTRRCPIGVTITTTCRVRHVSYSALQCNILVHC